jgi:hypothetical protein
MPINAASMATGPGSPTPLERLARDLINHCRARRLSGKTIDNVYRPRLEWLFLEAIRGRRGGCARRPSRRW